MNAQSAVQPMNPTTKRKIIVGMSGGVDSSVAALLLLEQGASVEGLFMKNWDEDDGSEYCTAQADFDDAQKVANRLGIVLHSANFAAEYWDNVFEHFLAEYRAGRTPNPDVLCNREIKFNVFIDYARSLNADRVATGHYARGRPGEHGYELHKAIDSQKDQTYFLNAVPRQQLAACEFPLGHLTKPEVRAIAARANLHNHQRKDSTGICFIGERRFRDFLARYVPAKPGRIHGVDGCSYGEHNGLHHYTIGQRQGLGIGGQARRIEAPWYVIDKHTASNTLVVSQDPDDLTSNWLTTPAINWLAQQPILPYRCSAKVRYRQPDQSCTLHRRADGTYWVDFDTPQRAVASGQYLCLYAGTQCLGGGVISSHGRFVSRASTAA
jgi:tRNA-specific 2-thiouridylase